MEGLRSRLEKQIDGVEWQRMAIWRFGVRDGRNRPERCLIVWRGYKIWVSSWASIRTYIAVIICYKCYRQAEMNNGICFCFILSPYPILLRQQGTCDLLPLPSHPFLHDVFGLISPQSTVVKSARGIGQRAKRAILVSTPPGHISFPSSNSSLHRD